jgi:hypothetical protein
MSEGFGEVVAEKDMMVFVLSKFKTHQIRDGSQGMACMPQNV